MEIAFSLGSNLGDRRSQLEQAVLRLLAVDGTSFVAKSPVYETEPVGVDPAHRHLSFLNQVLVVQSDLPPQVWLRHALRIECELGRVRDGSVNSPRLVDIDLLYAEGRTFDTPDLKLPHPRIHTRRFVLQPLVDVRPDLRLPGWIKTASELLADLPANSETVRHFSD
jgi:2-amino-4-hydroxy-6-hydroxymethyldihydropteridine diphosphokinase